MPFELDYSDDQAARRRSLAAESALNAGRQLRWSGRPDISAGHGTLVALAQEAVKRAGETPYEFSPADSATTFAGLGETGDASTLTAAAKRNTTAHLAALAGRQDIAAAPLQPLVIPEQQ